MFNLSMQQAELVFQCCVLVVEQIGLSSEFVIVDFHFA